MAFDAATAVRRVPRRRRGWFASTALGLFSVTVSLAAAAWVTNSDLFAFASAALPGNGAGNSDRTGSFASFEDRFFPKSLTPPPAVRAQLQPLDRSTVAALLMKFRGQEAMGPQQIPPDFRLGLTDSKVDEPRPVTSTGVPLPRSRPAAADILASAGPVPGQALALAQPDRPAERSLAQKISDLGRVTLASLTPDGLFRRKGPDLAALGYDGVTAVYDITAHAVYMPNGAVLEAHSGMGSMRDDLDHVNVPMTGATPPAEYELKPRERMFHGVAALRMTPVEGSDIYGRSGLLVHSYMLGRDGDSNGCVSIKDYDKFLKAFNDGEINRLVVIPSLSGATVVAQRSTQPS